MITRCIAVFFVVMLLVSCATTRKKRSNIDESKINYPLIEGYRVTLAPYSPRRTFYAGEKAVIVFKLMNIGKSPLTIYEWRLKESENVKLYYMPYKKVKTTKKSDWTCIPPETWGTRATLTLNPQNAALIEKKVPFITSLKPSDVSQGELKYLMFAELNLKSIRARSDVFVITIK